MRMNATMASDIRIQQNTATTTMFTEIDGVAVVEIWFNCSDTISETL